VGEILRYWDSELISRAKPFSRTSWGGDQRPSFSAKRGKTDCGEYRQAAGVGAQGLMRGLPYAAMASAK
jgi:hypothetical protein